MFIGSNDVETEIKVDHYNIVEGDQLQQYLIVQSIVLFNVLILLIDAIIVLRKSVKELAKGHSIPWISFVEVRVHWVSKGKAESFRMLDLRECKSDVETILAECG
jgi:hypothetical protein